MENQFVNITEDGGVQKRILVEGSGETPKLNNRCKIFYTGKLEDGTQFDTNVGEKKPLKFRLGTAEKVKGLDIGVQTMKKGEKAEFKLSSQYGYGEEGEEEKKVPPNSNLIFEVELVKFKEVKQRKKQRWEMTPEEKKDKALELRAQGTMYFKQKDYDSAKKDYKEALNYLLDCDTQEGKQVQASIHTNLSILSFLQKNYQDSINHATKAIDTNSSNEQQVKALYRRAVAYQSIGELEGAQKDLKAAYQLDNTNSAVIEDLQIVNQALKQARIKEKEQFSRMFQSKETKHVEEPPIVNQNENQENTQISEQIIEQSQEQQEEIETQASKQEDEIEIKQDPLLKET